jgi:hypothetical protein
MNIEELKSEWRQYSLKLETTQRLNEQVIMSMLRERSRSRVSMIRTKNGIYMALMLLNLVALAGIFIGNPFDFKYTVQYIPYGILTIGILLAIVSLFKSIRNFSVDINNVNLHSFLKKTITAYEKNKKIERWFGMLILAAGTFTAFSFLPNKLEHKTLWASIGETAISILITLAIYFIAFKTGAFKNRNKEGFENDLKEWDELKSISLELQETIG